MIKVDKIRQRMNAFGRDRKPFLFIIDFEKENGYFIENPINQEDMLFNIEGITNSSSKDFNFSNKEAYLKHYPLSYDDYKKKFDIIHKALLRGDSFLTNLTLKTRIDIDLSLEEIYHRSNSPFKLYIKDSLVCFSPECFVRIKDNKISTYPMKGTIDASIPDAENIILNNYKETAEHYTIVDLMRNDLNQIARNIRVERFRYLDLINTNKGKIFQVSSEVIGDLEDDYNNNIGDIILELLPAGSISGAPKESTVSIINKAEKEKRGFYTGVFGYFDGENLNSAVLIRYIEKENKEFFFRSGGGITINSNPRDEYQEVIDKIYLPF